MAQNASYNTIDRVIRTAMYQAGLIELGQDPSSEQFALYMNIMNDLISFEQTQGVKLFLNFAQPITPIQGVNLYNLGPNGPAPIIPRPTRVVDGYFVDQNNNQRPLFSMSWQEWDLLSNKGTQGAPNSYFIDKQETYLNAYIWQTPDAATALGTIYLVIQQPINLFVGLQDNPDSSFPPEWYSYLVWGLAAQICVGQPDAIVARCEKWATYYQTALENFDVEDTSIYFTADQREDMSGTSRFR
jgi:hypothetical protein